MFCFLCLALILLAGTQHAEPHTRVELGEFLLRNYSGKFFPLKTENAMSIDMSINLFQIIEVNAKDQYISLSVFVTEAWTDDYLFWNPIDFDGKDYLRVPAKLIWRPDTFLYNNFNMDQRSIEKETTATVYPKVAAGPNETNTAHVLMGFPIIYKVSCTMNVKYFPWDKQSCVLRFTSQTYDLTQFEYIISKGGAHTDSYLEHQEYSLVNFTVTTEVSCFMVEHPVKEPINICFSFVMFTIHIERKPLFYIFNLVVPSFTITVVCLMGLFSLSSGTGERTEKISLGMTTMLSLNIILLVISDQMPKTSLLIPIIGNSLFSREKRRSRHFSYLVAIITPCSNQLSYHHRTSLLAKMFLSATMFAVYVIYTGRKSCILGLYFLALMLLIAFALVASVFMVHLQNRSQTASSGPPLWLAWMSCRRKHVTPLKSSQKNIGEITSTTTDVPDQRLSFRSKKHNEVFSTGNEDRLQILQQQLVEVSDVFHHVLHKTEDREKKESNIREWEDAISALEKFLFVFFITMACISTAVFLLIGYNY